MCIRTWGLDMRDNVIAKGTDETSPKIWSLAFKIARTLTRHGHTFAQHKEERMHTLESTGIVWVRITMYQGLSPECSQIDTAILPKLV